MEEKTNILKLKKYAILTVLFFFLSIIFIVIGYSTIDLNNKDKINEIKRSNNSINSLNETYQTLNSKKNKLLANYQEIDALYLQIQNNFNQITQNNTVTNFEIVLLQEKISDYETQNINLQNDITALEAQLK